MAFPHNTFHVNTSCMDVLRPSNTFVPMPIFLNIPLKSKDIRFYEKHGHLFVLYKCKPMHNTKFSLHHLNLKNMTKSVLIPKDDHLRWDLNVNQSMSMSAIEVMDIIKHKDIMIYFMIL